MEAQSTMSETIGRLILSRKAGEKVTITDEQGRKIVVGWAPQRRGGNPNKRAKIVIEANLGAYKIERGAREEQPQVAASTAGELDPNDGD